MDSGASTVNDYQARFATAAKPAPAAQLVERSAPQPSPQSQPAPWVSAVQSTSGVIKVASALARAYRVETIDNLDKGGAFWVLERNPRSRLGRDLAELRMTFNADKGFWIK